MFYTILICLSIGIIVRAAYNHFKKRDWEDNLAETIVGIIVSAIIALIIQLAADHKAVLWVLLVAVGLVVKRGVEWLNKLHEQHL